MKTLPIFLASILFAVSSLYAVDESIAYHGALRDEQGKSLQETAVEIEFRLYSDPMGGTPLWGCCKHVDLGEGGVFNCQLAQGSETVKFKDAQFVTLDEALRASRHNSLYIGLTVKGMAGDPAGEIAPRQQLLAVPFSTYALDVDQASSDFAVAKKLTASEAAVSTLTVDGTATLKSAEVRQDLTVRGKVDADEFVGAGTVPVGTIVMYSGATIPKGWALCDGKDGRPNLIDRFIVGASPEGAGSYRLGATGGQNSVTLTEQQIPKHGHSIDVKTVGYSACWNGGNEATGAPSQGRNNGWQTLSTSKVGGSQSHENRPPYYALYYIIRVAK